MKTQRVAVVGFGFMGRMHFANWKKTKGAKVVALCDKVVAQFKSTLQGANLAGADASTDFTGIDLYEDFGQMLEKAQPDIVSITLPTQLHAPLTCQALAAGVNVICEKPMALSSADCAKMLKALAAAPKGTNLMVAHCLRFWPAYVYLKKLIDSGKYGKVLAADFSRFSPPPGWSKGKGWMLDERKSGGVALDLHIHDADLVCHLFGFPRAVKSAAVYNAAGAMQFINTQYAVGGAVVTSSGSWANNPTIGFESSFHVTFEHAVVIQDAKRAQPFCIYPANGKVIEPKLPAGDGYLYELKWFLDRVNGKPVPALITPEQSRDSVRLIEAEKKSAASGRTVQL